MRDAGGADAASATSIAGQSPFPRAAAPGAPAAARATPSAASAATSFERAPIACCTSTAECAHPKPDYFWCSTASPLSHFDPPSPESSPPLPPTVPLAPEAQTPPPPPPRVPESSPPTVPRSSVPLTQPPPRGPPYAPSSPSLPLPPRAHQLLRRSGQPLRGRPRLRPKSQEVELT